MKSLTNHRSVGILIALGVLMLLSILFSSCGGHTTETSATTPSTIITHEERHSYTAKSIQLVDDEASFELLPNHRCSVVFYVDAMTNDDVDISYTCVPADKMNSIWVEYSRPTSSEPSGGVIVGYNSPNFGISRFSTGWYIIDFFYDKLNNSLPTVEIYIRVNK